MVHGRVRRAGRPRAPLGALHPSPPPLKLREGAAAGTRMSPAADDGPGTLSTLPCKWVSRHGTISVMRWTVLVLLIATAGGCSRDAKKTLSTVGTAPNAQQL